MFGGCAFLSKTEIFTKSYFFSCLDVSINSKFNLFKDCWQTNQQGVCDVTWCYSFLFLLKWWDPCKNLENMWSGESEILQMAKNWKWKQHSGILLSLSPREKKTCVFVMCELQSLFPQAGNASMFYLSPRFSLFFFF